MRRKRREGGELREDREDKGITREADEKMEGREERVERSKVG